MPEKQTVYILGPMTGYAEENRPAFRKAAKYLRELGYVVTSPDELDTYAPAASHTWADLLRRDIPWVIQADLGVALPGWRASRGASLESAVLASLGRPVLELLGEELRAVPHDHLPRIVHPVSI